MKVAIASDHGGFEQKEALAEFLAQQGHELLKLGPVTEEPVDYPDFALLVARAVSEGSVECGVLVCGTGIGMAIAANKVDGIRAANVTTPEFAALAREHNNANVVALSGRFVDLETNKEIVTTFLATSFAEGRHSLRVEKICALEQLNIEHE